MKCSDRLSQLEFRRKMLLEDFRRRGKTRRHGNETRTLELENLITEENIEWEEPAFAWSDSGYGHANVSVIIASGVDGIGRLPRDKVF